MCNRWKTNWSTLSLQSLRKRYSPAAAADPSTTNGIIIAIHVAIHVVDIIAIFIDIIAIFIDIVVIFIDIIVIFIDIIAIHIDIIAIHIESIFDLISGISMKHRHSCRGSSDHQKEDEKGVASHPAEITSP